MVFLWPNNGQLEIEIKISIIPIAGKKKVFMDKADEIFARPLHCKLYNIAETI